MNLPIKKKALIETARLSLRPYSNSDTDSLIRLLTNQEIAKTFMLPDFSTASEAAELAARLISFSRTSDTEHLEYGIFLDNVLIGFINDCGIEERSIEIGYVIHPDYQGKGYATEAVSAVIDNLRNMGFETVTAGFFCGNTASQRVMEKCGMRLSDKLESVEYHGIARECFYCEINL